MIGLLDVHYGEGRACAACVVAEWTSDAATDSWTVEVSPIADYEPGQFYKRELPCLLAVLRERSLPACLVIDGYVWLGEGVPGLGAHLYEALDRRIPVVGIGKTAFRGSDFAAHVLRPSSRRPLFVTAVGMDRDEAAAHVAAMHGVSRIPTLVTRVDHLCRGSA